MGCDFSAETKQYFSQRISTIKLTSEEVKKAQDRVESYLKEFNEITSLPNEKDNIAKDLEISLKKLESILSDIKKSQALRSSDTFPIPPIQQYPEKYLSPEKVNLQATKRSERKTNKSLNSKQKNKRNGSNHKRQSVPKQSQQSILNDPEIMALISKNRQLLLRQLTR